MHFLEKYAQYYRDSVHVTHTRLITVAVLVLTAPLIRFLGTRALLVIPVVWLFACSLLKLPDRKFELMQGLSGPVLRIRGDEVVGNHVGFMGLTGMLYCVSKALFGWGDPFKYYAKIFGEVVLRATCMERQIRMPPTPIPRKKIIVTNHVTRPFMDSLSMFSFMGKDDPIIVLQHNFNRAVAAVGKWVWGAYTIDKDDKSYKNKIKLEAQLQELVSIMRMTENLTVVVYAQGKVPKSSQETRSPTRFFPGAFYLSLMTGYPVVPLVNDYREGVLINACLEPLYLDREYDHRIIKHQTVRRFRRANRMLLDEIGGRFVKIFRAQYKQIEEEERVAYTTKQSIINVLPKIPE